MGNLLFSPSGRIGPGEFMKGAIILIVLGVILSLPGLLGLPDSVVMIAGLVYFVLLWCWIALWAKRYHDGGKSGWMSIIPILIYIILSIVSVIVMGGSEISEIVTAMTEGASPDELKVFEDAFDAKINSIPFIAVSALVSLVIAFLFNAMIKQDKHDNQYGPFGSQSEQFN